ncbi:hypothetical protein [Methylocapsa palsarum]|uniref:Uncharacterized protein n=1 Tax=Methylocapsa palsarum TaxID=1612308 RepID=A0A1I3WZE6_9HYPH|nr:hypothetical protein [Methylocapsa palsarum]SFK12848.1 hypothetical protein SAMN05444581_102263 [Methylocapsa palsarum]
MNPVRLSRLFASALAAASLLPGMALATSGRSGADNHDGVYAVDVVTRQGACDRSYRWTIAVSGGRVRSTGDALMQASGSIDKNGVVALTFRRDNDFARAAGRVKGSTGSGAWSSPTLQCGGSWRATRLG